MVRRNSPIIVPSSMVMMVVVVPGCDHMIGTVTIPLLINLMVESEGVNVVLLATSVNENGKMPVYFLPVVLSLIDRVSEARDHKVNTSGVTRTKLISY